MLHKIIEEREKELDELMKNLPVNDFRVMHTDLVTNEKRTTLRGEIIKSHSHSTLILVIEEMIKKCEGMKRDKVSGGFEGEREMNIEIATYNEALSDIISYLREELQIIKEK